MLTGKQRATLRKEAAALTPVFQVGKGGVEEALIEATKNCLKVRELVKLKVLETSPQTAREAADALAEATGAEVVQVIGGVFVLFLAKNEGSGFHKTTKMRLDIKDIKKAKAPTKKGKPLSKKTRIAKQKAEKEQAAGTRFTGARAGKPASGARYSKVSGGGGRSSAGVGRSSSRNR